MAKIKKKAISLIEVLIAIIVVGVGIIVVLNVVIANI
jgi:Tfp pilus assembly protein PilV